jgi:hypothetical protein
MECITGQKGSQQGLASRLYTSAGIHSTSEGNENLPEVCGGVLPAAASRGKKRPGKIRPCEFQPTVYFNRTAQIRHGQRYHPTAGRSPSSQSAGETMPSSADFIAQAEG